MVEESNKRIYEAAFLVKGTEGEAVCEKLLGESGATIILKKAFTAVRLAYPIKRQESAFLGVFQFEASPDSVAPLREKASLRADILRFLIVTPPLGASKPESTPRETPEGGKPREEAIPRTGGGEALSNEALEETLEKILQ